MEVSIEQLRRQIQLVGSAVYVEPISKGFSADGKYLLVSASGDRLLLRTMDIQLALAKEQEFSLIRQFHKAGVRTSQPREFGLCEDLGLCYYILSYVDGTDASEGLSSYSDAAQYAIGVEAGRDLRVMHQLDAPAAVAPWGERQLQKYHKYLEAYQRLDVRIPQEEQVLQFVEENTSLLVNRPNRFQHDDFHVGNIIVQGGEYAGVIDFNRRDWGDPIHDFLKVGFFSREVSVPFCRGQIDGYYADGVQSDFWQLYCVYVAMSMIASVVWTVRVVPHTLDEMLQRITRVLADHDSFTSLRPMWFTV